MVHSTRPSNLEWSMGNNATLGKRKRSPGESTPPSKSMLHSLHPSPIAALQVPQTHSSLKICGLSGPQSHRLKENVDIEPKTLQSSPRRIHKLSSKRLKLGIRLNSTSKPTTQPNGEVAPKIVDQTGCHTCGRYPRYYHQLEQWNDCELCGLRTCYICVRTCEAQVGCNERKICRKCCVEKGEAGVVFCEECLQISTMLADEMLPDAS